MRIAHCRGVPGTFVLHCMMVNVTLTVIVCIRIEIGSVSK